MSQRTKVVGARTPILWLLIAISLIVVAVLAIGGLVVYPQFQRQQAEQARVAGAEQHYQAGVAFQSVSDWTAAEGEFKQVIVIDANYKDTQSRLAEVRARSGEEAAAATAGAIAQADKSRADVQATAAAAQATSAAAPTATAHAVEAHYQKGLGYMNMGRWQEAKAELEQVFAASPNYRDVQAKLAEVEAKLVSLTPISSPVPPTPKAANTPTAPMTPESSFFDNFDDGDAQGWTVIGSRASVVDGKYVLVGDPLIVTLAGSKTWRNYSLRTKVKIVSGRGDFGILVRASEDCRLYQMQFNTGELRLVRFDGGNCAVGNSYPWTKLASGSYRFDSTTWYNIRVDVRGTTIVGYINDAQVLSTEDGFYSQGKIGLRAVDTQMFFDDVEVVPLP